MNDRCLDVGHHGAGASEGDELVQLLEQQRNLCTRLKHIGSRQREFIAGDDPARLLALLAERRSVTAELAELGARLRRLSPDAQETSTEHRARARSLLAEAQETMRQIMGADAEDVRRLTIRKESVGSALRSIPTRKQMLRAYGPAAERARTRLDRTDEQE